MIEHPRHDPAVDRVEDQDDVENEEDEITLARILHDEHEHEPAQHQVGQVPDSRADRANFLELHEHVDGDGETDGGVRTCDTEIGNGPQPRVELVFAQRVEGEQHERDGDQREGEQYRPARRGQVVMEQVGEEGDRNDGIENLCHGA